jgi:TetR/AcrR family transcriptional regulator
MSEVTTNDVSSVASGDAGKQVKDPPRRRNKRQPEEVLANVLTAATTAFTRDGYKGARMRSIAVDAGITIQLLIYHVKTKDRLWEMVMNKMLTEYLEFHKSRTDSASSGTAADRLRIIISDVVVFHSNHPELHRIMTQEGMQPSPRLSWLTERFTRTVYQEFIEVAGQAQQEGSVRSDHSLSRLWYALIGIAAVPFSVAAEYEYLTGKNPFSTGEIKRTTELIESLIFGK